MQKVVNPSRPLKREHFGAQIYEILFNARFQSQMNNEVIMFSPNVANYSFKVWNYMLRALFT